MWEKKTQAWSQKWHWVYVGGGGGLKSFSCQTQLLSWVGVVTIIKIILKVNFEGLSRISIKKEGLVVSSLII